MASWADRSAFYVSKMLGEQIGINKKYSNFKKCIGINLLNFNYIKETSRFHTTYHISEDTKHIHYTDIMEWHVVELSKLSAIEGGSDLYNWVRFIKSERKKKFEMLAKKDEYIGEAYKQLEIISQDEQKRLEYTARQKAIYDYNTLMEENYLRGRAEERQEMSLNIANKLREMGVDEEIIRKSLEQT